MHINIPVTEELQDSLGGRFVLYSVYLEGFLLLKVRYKDLHLWDEQIHRVFGNRLPKYPPKFYLAMTKSMAEERRLQLEQYLQKLVSDPVVTDSEIFIEFFRKLQLDTFKMPALKIILNVYLADSKPVKVDVQTSDTAERVLEAALFKFGLSRELMEYFSLFITHKGNDGTFTVVKRIPSFELPFITIWNMNDDQFQIDIRKWYMNPSIDAMLMGCTSAINLLYTQAVQEFEMNWTRPTEEQREKLQYFIEKEKKIEFLELMQKVEHYGYLQLGSCTSDYPERGTNVTVSVGNTGMSCCFHSPKGQTEHLHFNIKNLTCWQVKLLIGKEDTGSASEQQLQFKFEHTQRDLLKQIIIYTEQAFLLSSCLKKILSEQPVKHKKEDLEIVDNTKIKKFSQKKECRTRERKESFLSYVKGNKAFDEFMDITL
ncbi:sorting nexin-31 [Rhinophrynus dorsalis]